MEISFCGRMLEPDEDQGDRPDAVTLTKAHARLAAITAYFRETGPVADKTSDDLRHELEYQNDWDWEDDPGDEEVTLLHLLQASTEALHADGEDADRRHIHHLIDCAFLEQEALRAIETLWPATYRHELTTEHLHLVEAATRPYLSERGLAALAGLAERVREPQRLPDYRAFLLRCFREGAPREGDPPTEADFLQALRHLETLTDHCLNAGFLWETTPADLLIRLDAQNAAERQQAHSQERPYTDTTMAALQALSRRRIAAMEATGWHLTHLYRPLCFLDRLIGQAVTLEAATLKTTDAALVTAAAAAR